MHFDRRFIVVIGLSLGWAVLVSGIFYRLAGQGRTSAKSGQPVVVAVDRLPVGATVTRESVKLSSIPADVFPKGAFSRIEEVLDRPVIEAVQAEEPLVGARLAERGSGLGLAPMIPSGMRAISVRVNDVVGVAGFILPGMHVDVLVTGRPPGRDDTVTRTVLQDITVLSAGQTFQADIKNPSISTTVVTLLVRPEQAEAVTLANNEGHVQLVLRNSADRQVASPGGKQLHELYGVGPQVALAPVGPVVSPRVEAAPRRARIQMAPPVAVEAPEPPAEMVIIKGGAKTTVRFPADAEAGK